MLFTITTLIACISFYVVIRRLYKPKHILVEECYQYVLKEHNRYEVYEFRPKNLEKRISLEVKGVTRRNRRQIAQAVIQKLIDNNVVEIVPDEYFDIYRVVQIKK
jgi:hypothetical protein